MPELPEVETACRGVSRALKGRRVEIVTIRERRLRWPISRAIDNALPGTRLLEVSRRSKYLLLRFESGTCIIHLGMSGSLRVVQAGEPYEKHDHFEAEFEGGSALRLRDPRRFGAVLWTTGDPGDHPRIRDLGPEPLSSSFDGAWLFEASRGRRGPVKAFVMNARVVVGVGNIYASEALFRAGVHPNRAAGRVSRLRYDGLAQAIREVLAEAIKRGGTTLRDFVGSGGEIGEFAFDLAVYGRNGDPCGICGATIRRLVIGQRSSFYCPSCQR